MKRLIATFSDADAGSINVTAIIAKAIDFKIETVDDEAVSKHAQRRRKIAGLGVPETIMQHYTARGEFSLDTAQAWLSKVGFNAKSASPALSRLAILGHVERDGNRFKYLKPLGIRGLLAAVS